MKKGGFMVISMPTPPSKELEDQAQKIKKQLNIADKVNQQTNVGYLETDLSIQLKINEQTLDLPIEIQNLLIDLIENIAEGKAVSLVPLDSEFTTQQAADFLNVSRPYLISLLDEGKILNRKVGKHRRVLYADLVKYKEKSYKRSMKALDEIVRISEELDLYE